MTAKEHVQDHLHKSATHHAAVSALHKKLSKTYETLARYHNDNAEKAAAHRDLGQFHANLSEQHDDRQRHYATLHSKMGDIGDAELFDSRSGAGDSLGNVAHAAFLKRCGVEL